MNDEALKPVNQELVQILVENHARFRSFLARRVGSEAMADDLLQQSLKKAIETPLRANEESSIVAWFYKILRNVLIDHYRAQSSEEKKRDELSTSLSIDGRDKTRAPDDLEAAICQCMGGLLPTLNEGYARLIQRVDLDGVSIKDAALELGITENNLSVRLHRARLALKASLEKACGTCTKHGCLDCSCG